MPTQQIFYNMARTS